MSLKSARKQSRDLDKGVVTQQSSWGKYFISACPVSIKHTTCLKVVGAHILMVSSSLTCLGIYNTYKSSSRAELSGRKA